MPLPIYMGLDLNADRPLTPGIVCHVLIREYRVKAEVSLRIPLLEQLGPESVPTSREQSGIF